MSNGFRVPFVAFSSLSHPTEAGGSWSARQQQCVTAEEVRSREGGHEQPEHFVVVSWDLHATLQFCPLRGCCAEDLCKAAKAFNGDLRQIGALRLEFQACTPSPQCFRGTFAEGGM